MKFKFLLTLLLCLALVCCFASCGSEGDDGDSEEAYTVTIKTTCGAFVKPVKVKNGKKVPLQLTVHTVCSVDEACVAPQLSACLGRGLYGVLQTSWGVLRYQHHKIKWHGSK